jgi:hypothetical protein
VKSWRERRRIAVIGSGRPNAEERAWAEAVGRALAQAGVVLVCGGRGGVMEAACRGAKEAGGVTVGILPGLDPTEANAYVDLPIVTGIGEARNLLVVHNAEGAVAVGGAYGTLSEIAFALRAGRPVVGLGTWDLRREGVNVPLCRADDPAEAVRTILALVEEQDS